MPTSDNSKDEPEAFIKSKGWPAFARGEGTTKSEKHLAILADKSFLNLWSYPSPYIDKRVNGKGDGKELCDVLVVCGDHVIIFSDKAIRWPDGESVILSWKRWYKRAILDSVRQIRGAERWINTYPDRIYLDRLCTQSLPIAIPPPGRRKTHGVIVASGAVEACKEFFGEGIGSLMILPWIEGDEHWKPDEVRPFTIGDVDGTGSFIHVLDNASLDIVMRELDTITDFTSYLTKKESIVRQGKLLVAGGEEDLVAYYTTHVNAVGRHDFTKPDGSSLGPHDKIGLQPGFYAELEANPKYIAKKIADKQSYIWDRIIERFTTSILSGSILSPGGESYNLENHERCVRHMAMVPRQMRRLLGNAILDVWDKGARIDRFTRAFFPGPSEAEQGTGFFFMALSAPAPNLNVGYEQYRSVRRDMLETYAFAILREKPELKRIVGIATEPRSNEPDSGSSEDLILAEMPEWTDEFIISLEQKKAAYNILQKRSYLEYSVRDNEYPNVYGSEIQDVSGNLTRKQRRAIKAMARKKSTK